MPKREVSLLEGRVEGRIQWIRGEKVLLDRDLAELYGVDTKRLKEQVRRNSERFPPDFMFELDSDEEIALRSQIATSNAGRAGRRSDARFREVFDALRALMAEDQKSRRRIGFGS